MTLRQKIWHKLRQNWVDLALIVILTLGILLRIWKLETHMIFFGDAGRDMLAATQAIQDKTPPLLGIPSSIPRFKQGPVFIWFIALIFLIAGPNPLMVGYVVALMCCIALVICFWLVSKTVNQQAAVYSTLLLASSPLAVAQSRMPYHITPIILCLLVYLFCLTRLGEQKKRSLFFACFSWAVLFQFELALFPLALLIPFTLFMTKQYLHLKKGQYLEILAGFSLGLLPQIIFDITHKFAQLGGFAIWIAYRIVAFLGYKADHTFSIGRLQDSVTLFFHYFSRIFSYDSLLIGVFMFSVSIIAVLYFTRFYKKQSLFILHICLGYVLLLVAFVVHGSPSEAYFPPIILLSVTIIGALISKLPIKIQACAMALLIVLSVVNLFQIFSQNFFTRPNTSAFEYGPSYGEKLMIMHWMTQQSTKFRLSSTDPDAHFESYLDDYKIIYQYLTKKRYVHNQDHAAYFINKKQSDTVALPESKITFFPSVDVIEVSDYAE